MEFTSSDVTYAYDAFGRMTSRVDAVGAWAWTYDAQSPRILSESSSLLPLLPSVHLIITRGPHECGPYARLAGGSIWVRRQGLRG